MLVFTLARWIARRTSLILFPWVLSRGTRLVLVLVVGVWSGSRVRRGVKDFAIERW